MTAPWKVFLVASGAAFMSFLDVTIVNIAFPDLQASFDSSSLSRLSWVLNAYNIVFAAALVPAGRFADRLGRRRLFLVGVAVFLAGSAASGAAPTAELLIAARTLQAIGAAIIVPSSLALILAEFPLERRATVTSLWAATAAVAAATGPALGGLLVDWQGWRLVFFVNLLVGLPLLLSARGLLREARELGSQPRPDLLGTAVLSVALGALALAIVEGPEWGWSSNGVLGALAVSLALLGLFVVRSARHPAPVIDLTLFRVRSFALANLGTLLFSIGFFAMLLSNVLFLTLAWDWSVLKAGVALSPGPLMAALTGAIGGRISDRIGPGVVAIPGSFLFAAGVGSLAVRAGADPAYASELLPGFMLTGAGVGLAVAGFGSAAVAELPRARFATGTAVLSSFRQFGAVLGISGLVAVLGTPAPEDLVDTFHRAWALMAGTGLAAALAAVVLVRRSGRPEAVVARTLVTDPSRFEPAPHDRRG